MEMFFLVVAVLAFLISGVAYFFLRRNVASAAISIAAPVFFLFIYLLVMRDEFGMWTIALTLGLCYCLMASALSVFIVGRFTKK